MYSRGLSPSHGDAIGVILVVITNVFLGLTTFAVSIRLWSRKIQRNGLFLNDYAAILAWVFAATLVITSNIETIHDGQGKHMGSVSLKNIPEILKTYIVADLVWAAANTSIRISIVHFYVTIFRPNKAFLTAAYIVTVLVLAFCVAIFVSDFLTCRPLSKAWDLLQPGTCENPVKSSIALSSCNIATDLIIVLLPMPMVWGLHMATRRKIELTVIFALGFTVCIITTIRLILSAQLKLDDYTYDISRIAIVTILEPLLGITIACLPLFPPAIKKLTARKSESETRNVFPSSITARLRLKKSQSSALQGFDDSFPLTDLEAKGTINHITGPSGESDYLSEGYGHFAGIRIPPQSSIMVEQDWEVRSDGARHLEEKL